MRTHTPVIKKSDFESRCEICSAWTEWRQGVCLSPNLYYKEVFPPEKTWGGRHELARPLKVSRLKNSKWPTRVRVSIESVPPEKLDMADTSLRVHSSCPAWRIQNGRHKLVRPLEWFSLKDSRAPHEQCVYYMCLASEYVLNSIWGFGPTFNRICNSGCPPDRKWLAASQQQRHLHIWRPPQDRNYHVDYADMCMTLGKLINTIPKPVAHVNACQSTSGVRPRPPKGWHEVTLYSYHVKLWSDTYQICGGNSWSL